MGKIMSKGEPFDPGSVLDAVVASNDAADRCFMYQLANFKKGGQLIDAFNKGGSKEVLGDNILPEIRQRNGQIFFAPKVENFMKEKLGGFMYNHGRGEFITRTEYLRWKFRDNTKVNVYRDTVVHRSYRSLRRHSKKKCMCMCAL